MTKVKVRELKWKRLKVRGLVLHFCLFFFIPRPSFTKFFPFIYLFIFIQDKNSTIA